MVGREGRPALALSPRTAEAQRILCKSVSGGRWAAWRSTGQTGNPRCGTSTLPSGPGTQPRCWGSPHTCCAQTGLFSDQRLSVIPVCWTLAEPEQDRHLGSERQLPDEGALALALPAG